MDENAAWTLLQSPDANLDRLLQPWGANNGEDALSPRVRWLLSLYLPLVQRSDFVIGQLGQSLDGRIATRTGHSRFVTGPEDIRHLHRLRALSDAVVVGAGTVAADDPRLTVREVTGRNPLRVVIDPRGRLRSTHRLFRDDAAPTLLVHGPDARPSVGSGVECLALPVEGGAITPHTLLAALRQRGLRRILVEGGGWTVSRWLEARLLDRLYITVAPILIGSGIHGISLPEIENLQEALRPACRRLPMGADCLYELTWN